MLPRSVKAGGRNDQAVKTCQDPDDPHSLPNFTLIIGKREAWVLYSQFPDADIESLNVGNSPSVTQLFSGRAGIQTQICLVPSWAVSITDNIASELLEYCWAGGRLELLTCYL